MVSSVSFLSSRAQRSLTEHPVLHSTIISLRTSARKKVLKLELEKTLKPNVSLSSAGSQILLRSRDEMARDIADYLHQPDIRDRMVIGAADNGHDADALTVGDLGGHLVHG